MSIRFSCAACGKRFQAADDVPGTGAKCPACGLWLEVPSHSPADAIPDPPPWPSAGRPTATAGNPGETWDEAASTAPGGEAKRPFWKDPIR
jgi:hypothetical protein